MAPTSKQEDAIPEKNNRRGGCFAVFELSGSMTFLLEGDVTAIGSTSKWAYVPSRPYGQELSTELSTALAKSRQVFLEEGSVSFGCKRGGHEPARNQPALDLPAQKSRRFLFA